MKTTKKLLAAILTAAILLTAAGCNSGQSGSSGSSSSGSSSVESSTLESSSTESSALESGSAESDEMTDEERIISAAQEGKVGNWGLGNEYEIQALLTKYGQSTDYVSMDFTMDQFDQDTITLASAMTYNELGLVKNDYEGAYRSRNRH